MSETPTTTQDPQAGVSSLACSQIFLEYEKYDKWGNIRLANSVLKTGCSPGDRVMQGPGNAVRPVSLIGTVTGLACWHGKDLMVPVQWDESYSCEINAEQIQRIDSANSGLNERGSE